MVSVQFLFGRKGVRQSAGDRQWGVFAMTDVCWAEQCSGWSCLLPSGGVRQIGKICRSFIAELARALFPAWKQQ